MEVTVRGLLKQYATCLDLKRVNLYGVQPLRELLQPLGTPEFFLLDANDQVLARWFGVTEPEEFEVVLTPACGI